MVLWHFSKRNRDFVGLELNRLCSLFTAARQSNHRNIFAARLTRIAAPGNNTTKQPQTINKQIRFSAFNARADAIPTYTFGK
jgi:hypothetical protein